VEKSTNVQMCSFEYHKVIIVCVCNVVIQFIIIFHTFLKKT